MPVGILPLQLASVSENNLILINVGGSCMTEQKNAEAHLMTLADGVHAWIGASGDSNAGAIETPEGLLVIDTQQYPRLARQIRDAVLAKTGKGLRAVINTHCHLDHTSGNTVFADVPILAHEKTLAAMNACLGPRSTDSWSVSDFSTKIRFLFGQNILELVPDDDPARRWFEGRINLPDYDTVVIRPPSQTFADRFAFHLPDETVRLHYFGPAHCERYKEWMPLNVRAAYRYLRSTRNELAQSQQRERRTVAKRAPGLLQCTSLLCWHRTD